MRSVRYLIILATFLVIWGALFSIVYILSSDDMKNGHLTCYSNDGQVVIFSEDVTNVYADGYMWQFDGGGISGTRPCVFPEAE